MYETILTCPKCGTETRLVADEVVTERDALREVAEAARDFMDDPGETNEKIDRLNDALAALERPE